MNNIDKHIDKYKCLDNMLEEIHYLYHKLRDVQRDYIQEDTREYQELLVLCALLNERICQWLNYNDCLE